MVNGQAYSVMHKCEMPKVKKGGKNLIYGEKKRVAIRNDEGDRLFDFVETEDGTEFLEVAGKKGKKTICLSKVEKQIETARKIG